MSKPKNKVPSAKPDALFDRIVSILDQARGNVVRAVNTNMVLAYWLIGQEIVEEVQRGKGRAKYGEKVIADLSARLTERYGNGFSVPNLKNFRQFYQAYSDRCASIGYPVGSQFEGTKNSRSSGAESSETTSLQPMGKELIHHKKSYPVSNQSLQVFSPQLSWSHYRALMRVEYLEARYFYEREAVEGGWDKRTLERQIHTQYYERCLHSQQPEKIIAEGRKLQKTEPCAARQKHSDMTGGCIPDR